MARRPLRRRARRAGRARRVHPLRRAGRGRLGLMRPPRAAETHGGGGVSVRASDAFKFEFLIHHTVTIINNLFC